MTEAKSRVASCACGAVRIELAGEPRIVGACNCTQCQRRTGSVFGVGGYFDRSQVLSMAGDTKTFERKADSGRSLSLRFCPECGTTLYWELEMMPQKIGVAVGCFADPEFPAPDRAVWCQTAHEWVTFPESLTLFPHGAT